MMKCEHLVLHACTLNMFTHIWNEILFLGFTHIDNEILLPGVTHMYTEHIFTFAMKLYYLV